MKLAQINTFDEIIDVRSPTEYAQDHIPGAINFPAIDDEERRLVGTLHKQKSVFEAKKQGASFMTNNISKYLQNNFSNRDDRWQPLIYCWRGGNRSKAFAHILQEIGWQAIQLPGGYKSYRSMVRESLEDLTMQFNFIVLCGRTGVGKSLMLAALKENNAQILDLETLANHRGSVLGNPLEGEQPTQKFFESLLCKQLNTLNPAQPIYVEAESRKIGKIQLPSHLLSCMRAAPCIHLQAELDVRIQYLIAEYQHFLIERPLLEEAMQKLAPFLSQQKITQWMSWKTPQDVEAFVRALLTEHYDPIYTRSMQNHFAHYTDTTSFELPSIDCTSFQNVAKQIIAQTI